MTQEEKDLVFRIGENMLRCMAIQAVIRTTGKATPQQINESAMAMTIATRAASRLMRWQRGKEEAYTLLPGTASEALSIIDYISDGALSLSMASLQEDAA